MKIDKIFQLESLKSYAVIKTAKNKNKNKNFKVNNKKNDGKP